MLLRGLPISAADFFLQLGVNVAVGGGRSTAPVLARRLEARRNLLRRPPTHTRFSAAVARGWHLCDAAGATCGGRRRGDAAGRDGLGDHGPAGVMGGDLRLPRQGSGLRGPDAGPPHLLGDAHPLRAGAPNDPLRTPQDLCKSLCRPSGTPAASPRREGPSGAPCTLSACSVGCH